MMAQNTSKEWTCHCCGLRAFYYSQQWELVDRFVCGSERGYAAETTRVVLCPTCSESFTHFLNATKAAYAGETVAGVGTETEGQE